MFLNIENEIVLLLKSDKYKLTMVNMNKSRLFDTGRDIEGGEIETFSKSGSKVYANRTIKAKIELDLPTNIVTGYMTGKLHDSIRAKVTKLFIDIQANKSRFNQFIENIASDHDLILGLSKFNQKIIFEMLERDVIEKIINSLVVEDFINTDILDNV